MPTSAMLLAAPVSEPYKMQSLHTACFNGGQLKASLILTTLGPSQSRTKWPRAVQAYVSRNVSAEGTQAENLKI